MESTIQNTGKEFIMGYIVFGDSNKIRPQDPQFMRVFIAWLVIFLILLMTKIEVFGIELARIWGGLLFVAIGLFILFVIVGAFVYQAKIHYPHLFDKLPIRIQKIFE